MKAVVTESGRTVNPRKCRGCPRMLTRARLLKNKFYCYPCECKVRREQKRKAHDRSIESEDFTREDYWELYEKQDGHCAIHTCRAQGKSRHLAVEHDHGCDRGHDPSRWCRHCVRGLVCSMHNEWIGRSGDNPEVFDSLASYLRDPPARKALVTSDAITLNGRDAINVLMKKYSFPERKALRVLDLARGVGPRPWPVTGGTVTVRYIREPRSRHGLYEISGQTEPSEVRAVPFRVSADVALRRLTEDLKFDEDRSKRILNIAWEFGLKREACPGGYVEVQYHGRSTAEDKHHLFSVTENIGETPQRKVASGEIKDYTQREMKMPSRYSSGKATTNRRRNDMARGRTQTAPEPAAAEQNGDAEDYTKYLTKDLTATMVDYATWMDQNLPGWDKIEVDRILALGSTLYPKFQKSQFNIDQRAARAAEREPAPEPAKPAARGTRAKPAAAKPAARGRSARAGSTRSASTPEAPF